MFKNLKALGKNPDSQELYRALNELYMFGYALLVVPIFVLSLIFARGFAVPNSSAFIYLGLCAVLCGVAFYLAEKPSSLIDARQTAFERSIRLALVSALPAVFGLISLSNPWAGKVLIASSMVLYVVLMPRLKVYSQVKTLEPQALDGDARAEV